MTRMAGAVDRKGARRSGPVPAKDEAPPAVPLSKRPSRYGRWRAATLAAVYVLFALHITHWKIAGKTLAPLELNEVMYTLELGIVTAGFLFMAAAFVSAAIFGRFFCSWGCHILALEDLCAWLLGKIGLRPKPVRSRVLLLVPPAAMFYMFIWPQLLRLLHGQPLPEIRILSDAEGWASFVTTDFWRNLPGPGITILTFVICGFAIVYFLGSRSFCTYACPYGVIFALADRVALGRIIAKGDCQQYGGCTAVCPSHLRVHEEIGKFGMVVDSSCLKCLTCLSACPNEALGYGFTRPSLLRSFSRVGRRRLRYDFTLGEDVLMAVVFIATLTIFRGLYDLVPFLMTLGLGCIFAYSAVIAVRLVRAENVRLNNFQLKRARRMTRSGRAFALGVIALTTFTVHSALIRYHEFLGNRAYDRILRASAVGTIDTASPLLAVAREHLEKIDRWGLLHPSYLDKRLGTLHLLADKPAAAKPYLDRVRRRDPADAHVLVAGVSAATGDYNPAIVSYEAALAEEPRQFHARMALAECFTAQGRFEDAAGHLAAAISIQPDSARAHYNLGVVLTQLGQEDDAIRHYRTAVSFAPHDPEIHNNLGFLLARHGELDAATQHFRKAIQLKPDFAHPHFNLGRLLLERGRIHEADAHLRAAAQLDPFYAQLLNELRENGATPR